MSTYVSCYHQIDRVMRKIATKNFSHVAQRAARPAGQATSDNKNYPPSRVQVMVGVGKPVASQGITASSPSGVSETS